VGALEARPAALPVDPWRSGGSAGLGEHRANANDQQQHRCSERSQSLKIYWKRLFVFPLPQMPADHRARRSGSVARDGFDRVGGLSITVKYRGL
jgi:hypothetical protein